MSDYETWWDDGNLVIQIEWKENKPFIHHAIRNKLTASLVKQHLVVLQGVCEELMEMGCTALYALSPCQSEKWKKLCKMFGFVELPSNGDKIIFVKEF